jgi:hypothetical protein
MNAETGTLLQMLPDLSGGRFLEKADSAMQAAASAAIQNGKAARVTLEFTMTRIGESNQVTLTHAVQFKVPTLRGTRTETDSTQTPLHVGASGRLTLLPDTQCAFNFDAAPAPDANEQNETGTE